MNEFLNKLLQLMWRGDMLCCTGHRLVEHIALQLHHHKYQHQIFCVLFWNLIWSTYPSCGYICVTYGNIRNMWQHMVICSTCGYMQLQAHGKMILSKTCQMSGRCSLMMLRQGCTHLVEKENRLASMLFFFLRS